MTRRAIAGTWAVALLITVGAAGAQDIPKVPVHFKPGTSSATLTRTLAGRETVDFVIGARAGQTMKVAMKTTNGAAYFNVLPPASTGEAIFIGSTEGLSFEGALPKDGDYAIRVYLMRSAARRGERANVTLTVSITGGRPAAPSGGPGGAGAFDKTCSLQGISFRVQCANDIATPTVAVTPSHLEIDNSPMTSKAEGHVVGAEVADLNADGSPEIYVYVREPGAPARGSLIAYAANRKKSLSGISLPALADDARLAKGYRGGDEFATVELVLARRFPIYADGDTKPSGRIRQIQYKLAQGEAGWVLKVDRVLEF